MLGHSLGTGLATQLQAASPRPPASPHPAAPHPASPHPASPQSTGTATREPASPHIFSVGFAPHQPRHTHRCLLFVVGFALPAAAAAAAAAHFFQKRFDLGREICFFLLSTFVFLWKRLGRSRSSTSHERNSVNSFRPRVESLFVFARYHTFSAENVCLHVETRATDKAAHRYCAVVVVVVVVVVAVVAVVVVLVVVVGCWLLEVGCCCCCCWLLVVGCWLLLVVGCCWKQTFFEKQFLFVFRHTDGKCVFTC